VRSYVSSRSPLLEHGYGICSETNEDGFVRTSEPTSPPTADLALPIVWFQLPSVRLGSSLVTAPEEEAEKFPIFAVACEASFSS
jgi:hypothetical protein